MKTYLVHRSMNCWHTAYGLLTALCRQTMWQTSARKGSLVCFKLRSPAFVVTLPHDSRDADCRRRSSAVSDPRRCNYARR